VPLSRGGGWGGRERGRGEGLGWGSSEAKLAPPLGDRGEDSGRQPGFKILSPHTRPSGGPGGIMLTQGRKMQVGKRYHRPGTAPGTLVPWDPDKSGPVRIRVMDYGPDHFEEL